VTGFKNAELDKLLDEAGQTDDAARKLALISQANKLIFEHAPVWFFNYNKAAMAYQPWVHGLQANATELTHQYVEDVWVDATSPAR
jgi:peptide/nickel transport system substrate-binding protein